LGAIFAEKRRPISVDEEHAPPRFWCGVCSGYTHRFLFQLKHARSQHIQTNRQIAQTAAPGCWMAIAFGVLGHFTGAENRFLRSVQ
jgi:hypothetical protein